MRSTSDISQQSVFPQFPFCECTQPNSCPMTTDHRKVHLSLALQNPRSSVTISELQPDLIGEILARLPAKSLLRFRSVSKHWRDLIDSPHFTKIHINQSIQSGRNQALILSDLHSDRLYSVSFDSLEKAEELDYPVRYLAEDDGVLGSQSPVFSGQTSAGPQCYVLRRRSQVPERGRERHRQNQVWGCCHGLILLRNCLWNPTTRKHSSIPDMKVKRITLTRGFGYDSSSDDYKVVKIVKNSISGIDDMSFAFWVYTLKSNSWRKVPDFPSMIERGSEPELRKLPPSSYLWMEPGVLVNEALHWLVKGKFSVNGENQNDYIMAFDLRKEEYKMISQPKCEETHSFSNLGVVNGHLLCLICSDCTRGFDIWVMEEYGVAGSWTRMALRNEALISYPGGLTKAYARDGEKMLLVQSNNGLRWYGLKRMIMEDVMIMNKPHAHDNTNVCLSSLVPLDEDD